MQQVKWETWAMIKIPADRPSETRGHAQIPTSTDSSCKTMNHTQIPTSTDTPWKTRGHAQTPASTDTPSKIRGHAQISCIYRHTTQSRGHAHTTQSWRPLPDFLHLQTHHPKPGASLHFLHLLIDYSKPRGKPRFSGCTNWFKSLTDFITATWVCEEVSLSLIYGAWKIIPRTVGSEPLLATQPGCSYTSNLIKRVKDVSFILLRNGQPR